MFRLSPSCILTVLLLALGFARPAHAQNPAPLLAGAAKVEITNKSVLHLDPLYAKALVLKNDRTTAVIITLDVVSIGHIGYIPNDFFGKVRARLKKDLNIAAESIIINASHCHARPCADVEDKTVEAVAKAVANLAPAVVGVGVGREDRISENRRLKLKSGKEADVRHAYALPPDDEVVGVGPIDPTIGVLRVDKKSGGTIAVVYNFACHPIMGMPKGDNTADLVGFASKAIEDNLDPGTVALFVQGCAGDINPLGYKQIHQPRNAEPLGNMLGLSVLQAVRKIRCDKTTPLAIHNEKLGLPRADNAKRIDALMLEQAKLLKSLQGTSLSLRAFLELNAKYNLSPDSPSFSSHRYMTEKQLGRDDLLKLDEANRRALKAYLENIYVMEELTRVQTNLRLLRMHYETNRNAGMKPLEVEVVGFRAGDFVLMTFPGELTVEIGLGIKKRSPHKHTFVAGYSNGYIFYTPTAKQLENVGNAQEDSDCLVAPAWQRMFEDKVSEMLGKL